MDGEVLRFEEGLNPPLGGMDRSCRDSVLECVIYTYCDGVYHLFKHQKLVSMLLHFSSQTPNPHNC